MGLTGSQISNVAGNGNLAAGGLSLTAGTTYFAVATAFSNTGVGSYSLKIGGGPGTVTPVNPVPEPATMAALGFGALALIKRRRKG